MTSKTAMRAARIASLLILAAGVAIGGVWWLAAWLDRGMVN
jgi:hypothetical protein